MLKSPTARIEARVEKDIYSNIKEAARIEGLTLTSFIVTTLKKAADKTIENNSMIKLAKKDQILFAEKLLNPHPITPAMKEALELHEQRVTE